MGDSIHDSDGLNQPGAAFAGAVPQRTAAAGVIRKSSKLLLLFAACTLSACVTTSEHDSGDWQGSGAGNVASGGSPVARQAVNVALEMKGVPYLWGGTTPAGFDCSGLIYYSYAKAGMQVPRNSKAQYAAAVKVSPESAEPGDLLFFFHDDKWHVALYMGNQKFIHAPWPGSTVSIASLRDSFYRSKLVGVGRLTAG